MIGLKVITFFFHLLKNGLEKAVFCSFYEQGTLFLLVSPLLTDKNQWIKRWVGKPFYSLSVEKSGPHVMG